MIDKSYIIHDDDRIHGFFDKYRFLSNFYPAPVYFEGVLYPSSEHAYQAAKTDDVDTRKTLFLNCTAGTAKRNSYAIINKNPNWYHIKYDVMSSVVFEKFYRNLDLRYQLLETGKRYLEETNHWNDIYWGVCNGRGENNLGRILMGIRSFWSIHYPDLLGKKQANITPLF